MIVVGLAQAWRGVDLHLYGGLKTVVTLYDEGVETEPCSGFTFRRRRLLKYPTPFS